MRNPREAIMRGRIIRMFPSDWGERKGTVGDAAAGGVKIRTWIGKR